MVSQVQCHPARHLSCEAALKTCFTMLSAPGEVETALRFHELQLGLETGAPFRLLFARMA